MDADHRTQIEAALRDVRHAARQLQARLGSADSVMGLTCCSVALQALDHARDTLAAVLDGTPPRAQGCAPERYATSPEAIPTVADPHWHRAPLWRRVLSRVF